MIAPALNQPVLQNFDIAPQIVLTWSDANNDEDNYLVERKDGWSGSFLNIVILGANVTTYTDTGIVNGVSYTYRVRAYKNSGPTYSNYSSLRTISVPFVNSSPYLSAGGIGYGISQETGVDHNPANAAIDTVIVNNYMFNNGLGNLDSDFMIAPNVTVHNPQVESLHIRRGIIIST